MLIAGAKGFAIQLTDTCLQINPVEQLVFYDDISEGSPAKVLGKFPILTSEESVKRYFKEISPAFALGTGNPETRKMFFNWFKNLGGKPITIISPKAVIGTIDVVIDEGCCILTNSIIESTASVGRGCLINLNVMVTHGASIGNFCELSPGVKILGDCQIEEKVFIGSGAVILPGIVVGKNARIGAGAVVTKNVPPHTTVVGVPAKVI